MKLVFIGTGSAFTVGGNYQSNMFFETDSKKRLLIDCGSDARHGLYELGLNHNDIDAVYISHMHADHTGGLEWLAFSTMFGKKEPGKINLLCSEKLVKSLWEMLNGGLSSLETEKAELSHYFQVCSIDSSNTFTWEGVKFNIFPTVHQISNFHLMPSYGIETNVNGVEVLISSDTKFPIAESDELKKRYPKADIIFQDCETSPFKSTVHAHYSELVTLAPEIKKKMWLYHYQPGPLPDAKKDGFAGFIKKGQVFDFAKG